MSDNKIICTSRDIEISDDIIDLFSVAYGSLYYNSQEVLKIIAKYRLEILNSIKQETNE